MGEEREKGGESRLEGGGGRCWEEGKEEGKGRVRVCTGEGDGAGEKREGRAARSLGSGRGRFVETARRGWGTGEEEGA